ncbi:PAS domain-containing sensor histidine kinase [Psychrobium sp. 1_MG-2023]|uniref:sensor histidine kinase n=1 Tax=Psychrobium sp. 1_MG-2023 TaxID=3062624 RepID=UPI00268FA0CE|nr:ATP-binding protein [Psychrobium sp. 1_MG-2023]MDP2562588.1 ATP-binding protein [Psychrobium sp. 1_MG-2023]
MFGLLNAITHKVNEIDIQLKLILLVCVPCFTLTAFSLFFSGVSGYLIAFILILLTLLCSYVAITSKYHAEHQIRTFSNLIESMIDGDYSLRGHAQNNQALQELLTLINELADHLAAHKVEAKESRLLLERIMQQMDAMVLATDEQGVVVMTNTSAHTILFPQLDSLDGVKLDDTSLGLEIVSAPAGVISFNQPELSGEYFLFKDDFLSSGNKHHLYMLTNAERLLMEKERQAWQSLLRVLSHEMNNSLAPIIAISQSMKKKLDQVDTELKAESLLTGVGIINERAASLSGFIGSYSQLSHLPEPNFSSFGLANVIERLALLFPEAELKHNIDVELIIEADKGQFEQVIINLFKNAAEAMHGQAQPLIIVDTESRANWLHINIKDTGVGLANLDNIFVPFFTTKAQGSGIGLALCRQIMFNHNGMIKLSNRAGKGVVATLSLPIAASTS